MMMPASRDAHPELQNEQVVVLGGAGLIGTAICAELVEHGARILVVDDRQQSLDRLPGDSIEPYVCDITQPDQRARLVARIAETAPRYLVHSAGGASGLPGEFPDPFQWFALHDVHLFSPILLAHEVLVARHQWGERGSAVLLSSVHARYLQNDAVYSSAKASLEMAARELAATVAEHGSRVNVVAPGHVATEPTVSRPTKLGRQSLPAESIAKSVRFLLCDDCSPSTTGAVLEVDGGLSLWVPWGPD